MKFKCKTYDEYVESDECYECECNEDCEQMKENIQSELGNKSISESKFIITCKEKLKDMFDMNDEDLTIYISNMSKDFLKHIQRQIQDTLKFLIHSEIKKQLKENVSFFLDSNFKDALAGEIIIATKDENYAKIKIQEIALNKIKSFLTQKGGYNDRSIAKTLDEVISEKVSKDTEIAISELKKETIEKFNKEAMKAMMSGMAKTLGNDTKLLQILTNI